MTNRKSRRWVILPYLSRSETDISQPLTERARIEAVSFFQSYGFSEQLAEGSSRMIRIGNDLEASGVLVARDSVDGDEDWEKVARE